MEDLAVDFYEKLAEAIFAFEMPIDRIEGKFKLGQNRSQVIGYRLTGKLERRSDLWASREILVTIVVHAG